MKKQHNVSQKECNRCGKCCIKGGPTLHKKDKDLVVSGFLHPRDLILFRCYETAFDPSSGKLISLDTELIKIRGKNDVGECKFYNKEEAGCTIYEKRPLECVMLKCWDTSDIEKILLKDVLTRADLIPKNSVLWRIIEEYERTFNLILIRSTLESLKNRAEQHNFLKDLFKKDFAFRKTLERDMEIQLDDQKFFLGRPLAEIFNSDLLKNKNE